MADLAMKTSGATKAAVRTIDPLTVYATYLHKVHVSSTDVKATNGDRTWDTHRNLSDSPNPLKNP